MSDWVTTYPLHKAALEGDEAAVQRALAAPGCDVNQVDTDTWTPLHYAAWYGHASVVTTLLGAGADCNIANESGATPLHLAAGTGRPAVVEVLLSHPGINIGAKNKEKQRPVDLAKQLQMNEWQQVVQLLSQSK